MTCRCDIRASGGFKDWNDFQAHATSLTSAGWEETPVLKPKTNVGFVERWFRCSSCNQVWRLIEPDPPFPGSWEKVDQP
jgi:hypothetical protein